MIARRLRPYRATLGRDDTRRWPHGNPAVKSNQSAGNAEGPSRPLDLSVPADYRTVLSLLTHSGKCGGQGGDGAAVVSTPGGHGAAGDPQTGESSGRHETPVGGSGL